MVSVPLIPLGTQGLQVSQIGLGCMEMSFYGPSVADGGGIALIEHAFNKGVTFFDTADIYGPFTNEVLVGQALKRLPREKVQLATKFGNVFIDGAIQVKGSSDYVRKACEDSLNRLDVEYIDLYYQHRVDTIVPIEETVWELKKLVEEGKIKYIGLSEASVDTIRRAHAVHPITAVQLEWSLWTRDVEIEIIPTCRELGIGIVPYSPLGHGFFAGKPIVEELNDDVRCMVQQPRFEGENLEKNKVLYERVSGLAKKRGCTPAQLALSWVLHQGNDVVPIPGTTKIKHFDENIASLEIKLTQQELNEITSAVPGHEVSGLRLGGVQYERTWQFANTPQLKGN